MRVPPPPCQTGSIDLLDGSDRLSQITVQYWSPLRRVQGPPLEPARSEPNLAPVTTAPGFGENDGIVMLDSSTWLFCHWSEGLMRTGDSGATWDDVTPAGAHSSSCNVYTPHIYRSEGGTYYLPSQNGVLTSSDGASWALDTAPGRLTGIMETSTQVFGGFMWAPGYQVSPPDPWLCDPASRRVCPSRMTMRLP